MTREDPPSVKGSCHCGKVTFEVAGKPGDALSCNCSLCSRKGALLWAVSREEFQLLGGKDALSTYTFNKHRIRHYFCSTCGIHPYSEGVDPDGNRMTVVNIRCIENIDPDGMPVQHFDGRSI